MAHGSGPPFDFDLNEPPPEDDEVANDASPALEPEPVCEPSPRDLLPPSPENTLPSPRDDSLPAPEPTPRDPLPALLPESSPRDPLPAPVPESSPRDPRPSPSHEPSPRDPLHPPSPALDLEAPLSSLDDDYDEEYNYDEADLPPPPPLPPHGVVPVAAAPAQSSYSVDALGALPSRPDCHGERASQEPFVGDAVARLSSPENSAPRGPSSGTAPSHRSRRRPLHSHDPRGDDAISKQRRVGSHDDDDDARSSRSGSRRSELASPPPYEQGGGGGRHAPAAHGEPGAPPRNRRTRRRSQPRPPQQGYAYTGSIPKQQGRGWEQPQGLRGGQQRPQVHQSHGPHGPEAPKVGYSSYYPLTGSYGDDRHGPEQEHFNGNGEYHHQQRREAPPPPSRPRGREDPYYGRRSQAQGPPKAGGYQHSREGPSLRPFSGAHGRDGSSASGGRPQQQPVNGGGAYQQRKATPRGGERFPDRPYHPYARDSAAGGGFDRANGGTNYWHRRHGNKQQRTAGGPALGRQYYGD